MSVLVFLFADLTPASAVSGSLGAYAAGCALLYLTCDADLKDFDPRPALARTTNPVWQAAVNAGRDLDWAAASGQHYVGEFVRDVRSFARLSLRESALTAAALYALLTITPGATR